jgi:Ran GTPase-activating protein (RanGAP) involved in mRNA processing and transport
VALIRKRITSTVNLAHMGLGTKIAKVLAPCLSALPYLQLLNLSDNHLDDEGLSVLLRAISKHKSIEILDISQNVIGQEAAEALAVFLGRRDCHLQCLRMSNANIDDGECANFVEVLMSNHHLKVGAVCAFVYLARGRCSLRSQSHSQCRSFHIVL